MAETLLTRFSDAGSFRSIAEPFLLTAEAEHNLALGLLPGLERNPHRYGSEPYFATVMNGQSVISAAIMTPPHRLVLSLTESASALEMLAHDVFSWRSDTAGVVAPSPTARLFSETWRDVTGQAFQRNRAERIYRVVKVRLPMGVPGHIRRIVESDRSLVGELFKAFQLEALGAIEEDSALNRSLDALLNSPPELRGAFLWCDPTPVCFVGYGGPTPNSMRIGPVYTPPEYRRRGYASACTAAVSASLLDNGRQFVTLFTDLSNPTSNAIYQAIGFQPVCDVDEYDFIARQLAPHAGR